MEATTPVLSPEEAKKLIAASRLVSSRVLGTGADKNLVDELTSDTYTKALKAWDEYDQARPLGPWLALIARNCHMDNIRAAKAKSRDALRGEAAESLIDGVITLARTGGKVGKKRLRGENGLTDHQRHLIHEMAELTGWGSPRLHGWMIKHPKEMSGMGFDTIPSPRTVARAMKAPAIPSVKRVTTLPSVRLARAACPPGGSFYAPCTSAMMCAEAV